jgi:hypothetical protein
VVAICLVQAGLSLTLVRSNTAFGDEAEYLWIGRLLLAHWLHGTSWPSAYADLQMSGSPVIYPPLGALANSAGGLAGARILSLAFMLGATVLLYLTASRLLGRAGALFAAALWAFTEPVIRLAFATYDPLSILLTALSAWLAVQAAYRHRRPALVAMSALALALSTATAYSGIVFDPIVVAFAFLIWQARMPARRALLCLAYFLGCAAAFFALLMLASHSWAGLMSTVIDRHVSVRQSLLLVLGDSWTYSGLIVCLAVVGAIAAIATDSRRQAILIVLLACAAFVAPAAQMRDQTGVSLDKHLAYGIWFGAIAAGYGGRQLIRWLPDASRRLTAVCCIVALAYPAITGWQSAWAVYHDWGNASSFISEFAPVAARSSGYLYAAGQDHLAEYYTPEGNNWQRWSSDISLDPTAIKPTAWPSYYAKLLTSRQYGVIALFYTTTFSSGGLTGSIQLSPHDLTNQQLLSLSQVAAKSSGLGLVALTKALEKSRNYARRGVGRYDSSLGETVYVIWQKALT